MPLTVIIHSGSHRGSDSGQVQEENLLGTRTDGQKHADNIVNVITSMS